MPPTVSWPTSRPVVRHDERQHPPAARLARAGGGPSPGSRRSRGRRRGRRRSPPRAAASRVAAADLAPGRAVAQPDRPERDPPVRQRRPASRGQWPLHRRLDVRSVGGRRRGSGRPRARAAGRARPGRRARRPVEPGRLTISVRPATPASPRDSAAVGTPWRDAVRRGSPRRCRAPRGRAPARVISGVRSVGREAGAAGGDDHVVRRRRPPRAAPPPPARRRAPPAGRRPSKPELGQPVDEQRPGPVLVDAGRRRGWTTVTTSALTRRSPSRAAASRARTCRRSSPRPARR